MIVWRLTWALDVTLATRDLWIPVKIAQLKLQFSESKRLLENALAIQEHKTSLQIFPNMEQANVSMRHFRSQMTLLIRSGMTTVKDGDQVWVLPTVKRSDWRVGSVIQARDSQGQVFSETILGVDQGSVQIRFRGSGFEWLPKDSQRLLDSVNPTSDPVIMVAKNPTWNLKRDDLELTLHFGDKSLTIQYEEYRDLGQVWPYCLPGLSNEQTARCYRLLTKVIYPSNNPWGIFVLSQ